MESPKAFLTESAIGNGAGPLPPKVAVVTLQDYFGSEVSMSLPLSFVDGIWCLTMPTGEVLEWMRFQTSSSYN